MFVLNLIDKAVVDALLLSVDCSVSSANFLDLIGLPDRRSATSLVQQHARKSGDIFTTCGVPLEVDSRLLEAQVGSVNHTKSDSDPSFSAFYLNLLGADKGGGRPDVSRRMVPDSDELHDRQALAEEVLLERFSGTDPDGVFSSQGRDTPYVPYLLNPGFATSGARTPSPLTWM